MAIETQLEDDSTSGELDSTEVPLMKPSPSMFVATLCDQQWACYSSAAVTATAGISLCLCLPAQMLLCVLQMLTRAYIPEAVAPAVQTLQVPV